MKQISQILSGWIFLFFSKVFRSFELIQNILFFLDCPWVEMTIFFPFYFPFHFLCISVLHICLSWKSDTVLRDVLLHCVLFSSPLRSTTSIRPTWSLPWQQTHVWDGYVFFSLCFLKSSPFLFKHSNTVLFLLFQTWWAPVAPHLPTLTDL